MKCFLVFGLAAAAAPAFAQSTPLPTWNPPEARSPVYAPARSAPSHGDVSLAFRNLHTSEFVTAVFVRGGRFEPAGLRRLDEALRDWRVARAKPMDPNLFMLLVKIRDRLGVPASTPFELISGFRSPQTNTTLRRVGEGGVATKSQHVEGKAADVRLPGVTTERLRGMALAIQGGGVGYYPSEGFVHIDTGRVRAWGGTPLASVGPYRSPPPRLADEGQRPLAMDRD